MKHELKRVYFGLSLILSAIIIAGCSPKSYEKQHYILDAKRESVAIAGKNKNIIDVRRFTVASAFNTKNLIYRIGEFEYETDFYNEFLASPAAMIAEKVRDWLASSGIAHRVSDTGSNIEPTHIIEGNVIALYGDFRDQSTPKALMEIRIFLLETKSEIETSIVFGNTYTASMEFEFKSPENLVIALNHCLTQILSDLEKDLAKSLL